MATKHRKNRLLQTAKHEAAHVVLAVFYGGIVESCEIDLHGKASSGITWISDDDALTPLQWAIIGSAGSVVDGCDYLNDTDLQLVTDAGYSEKDLDLLFGIARGVLDKLQEELNLITEALAEKKKLTWEEIQDILKGDYGT